VRGAFHVTATLCVVSAVLFLVLDGPIKAHAIHPRAEAPSRITISALSGVLKSRALLPIIMVSLGASIVASLNNFQTVFADARGLDYVNLFLTYTITVVVFRLVLARFMGGKPLSHNRISSIYHGFEHRYLYVQWREPASLSNRRCPFRHWLRCVVPDPCCHGCE